MKKIINLLLASIIFNTVVIAETKVLIRNVPTCTLEEKRILKIAISNIELSINKQNLSMFTLAQKGSECSFEDLNITYETTRNWKFLVEAKMYANFIEDKKSKLTKGIFEKFETTLWKSGYDFDRLPFDREEYTRIKKAFFIGRIKSVLKDPEDANISKKVKVYILIKKGSLKLDELDFLDKNLTNEVKDLSDELSEEAVISVKRMLNSSKLSISVTQDFSNRFLNLLKIINFRNENVFSEDHLEAAKLYRIVLRSPGLVDRNTLKELYELLVSSGKKLDELPIIAE